MRLAPLFILILVSVSVWSSQTQYRDGQSFGAAEQNKIQAGASALNHSVMPGGFTSNPSETNITPEALSKGIVPNSEKNKAAIKHRDFLIGTHNKRVRFDITADDPAIKLAKSLNAQGQALNTKECVTVPVSCGGSHDLATCEESLHFTERFCAKDLIVDIKPAEQVDSIVSLEINTVNYDDTTFSVDMKTGKIISIIGYYANQITASAKLSETIPIEACPSLIASQFRKTIVVRPGFRVKDTRIKFIESPTCENGLVAKVFIRHNGRGKMRRRGGIFEFKVSYEKSASVSKEYWQNNCSSLEEATHSGVCKQIKEECVDSNKTRLISGIEVVRDCWKKRITYRCAQSDIKNTCEVLKQQGCSQVNSTCKQYLNDGICAVFKQTYRCPKNNKDCEGKTKTICNVKPFCAKGDCLDTTSHPNQDFKKAITQLSALKEAGESFSDELHQVFKGNAQACRSVFLDYKNCCKDKGWGLDAGLAECEEDEKKLAEHKSNGLCHYVGKYCDKKILGKCVRKKKSYCCFDSKLSRVLQESGRQQLAVSWGKAKRPQCRGLTPEELAKINFDKIDFSEVYQDVLKNMKLPEANNTAQTVSTTIQKYFQKHEQDPLALTKGAHHD